MPAGNLLMLLDDSVLMFDDVAVLTKLATKKTAGVLGDDLALNAEQVAGVRPERELPVVWAVAKGSLRNKAVLVPLAVAISAFAPWAVTPLLMLGGAFLCFEGFEKVLHKLLPSTAHQQHQTAHRQAVADVSVDLREVEKAKISGAIRTDAVLSAEIIVIALGVVAAAPFWTRLTVLVSLSLAMTVGVYGFVAGIVKLDDMGVFLAQSSSPARRWLGRSILWVAPLLMRVLSVVGTLAMFMVGGGIIVHGLAPFGLHPHDWLPQNPTWLLSLSSTVVDFVGGVVTGGVVFGVVSLVLKIRSAR